MRRTAVDGCLEGGLTTIAYHGTQHVLNLTIKDSIQIQRSLEESQYITLASAIHITFFEQYVFYMPKNDLKILRTNQSLGTKSDCACSSRPSTLCRNQLTKIHSNLNALLRLSMINAMQ
jgi:hypothetical protein